MNIKYPTYNSQLPTDPKPGDDCLDIGPCLLDIRYLDYYLGNPCCFETMAKPLLAVLLFYMFSFFASAQGNSAYKVDDFQGDSDRDKINAALCAMKDFKGPKTLIFTRREYLVEPVDRNTFEPVIGVDGVSQLSIEGNGAVLVAKDALDCQKGYFLRISKFSDLKVSGLVLTFRPLPYIQGKILEVNQKENKVAVELAPGFDKADALKMSPNSEFWCRVGLKNAPCLPKPDSPSWLAVKVDGNSPIGTVRAGTGVIDLRAGYFNPEMTIGGGYNWTEGEPFVAWKRGAQDGICLEDGKNLELADIRIESSLHYAIKIRGVVKAVVRNCEVSPVPGGMISSGADGVDVQQSCSIVIEKCRFASTGDDAISFLNHGHGYNGLKYESKFPSPYPESNCDVLIRGNILEGGNRNGILLLASDAEVESNKISDIRQYGLKFTGDNTRITGNLFRGIATFSAYRHIKDELDTGVICSDEWIQNNAVISGNTIENWRHMPGILIKSVHGAVVEGNVFRTGDPSLTSEKPFNPYLEHNKAICVTGSVFLNEQKKCRDVLIARNQVEAPGAWASIEDAVCVNGDHENIVVRDNLTGKKE